MYFCGLIKKAEIFKGGRLVYPSDMPLVLDENRGHDVNVQNSLK